MKRIVMTYNSRPKINLQFDEDLKYFRYLFDAILNVHRSFIHEDSKEQLERIFAYELYRQWANLLDANGLTLNGEPRKELWRLDSREGVSPDLVLHASQSSDANQKMICEIKRKANGDNKAFFEDFEKLCRYLTEGLFPKQDNGEAYKPFDYGVFIFVGGRGKLKPIKKKLKLKSSLFKDPEKVDKYRETFSRIVCIAYNGEEDQEGDRHLEYDTLDNILNKRKPRNRKALPRNLK